MYLKSLELSGFKSFARKATLQFTSSTTAIVGPNGSGKSNTAEAFKFVLGEQSIKSLRGKRGEDMIWNGGDGSSGAGRANRASVKLTFDNSSKLFPTVDFDEVMIERVVNRDNANEYLLNGSQVRLKDIVELLASAHIGATGHHIISQGEADRILSASIRERREMIEDALGLKIYQWKKLESIRKLERTEENMKQVESLRREIAPHLKFLKKQVEKVEKATELRRELVELYREYFAMENHRIRSEKARIHDGLSLPRKEAAELEHELERAKKIITDSKVKDEKSGEIIRLEEKIARVRIEKDVVVRETGRIEGEISANERAIEKERERQKRDEFKTIYLKDLEEVVTSIESLKIEDVGKLFSEIVGMLKGFISRHRSVVNATTVAEAEREIATLKNQKSALESKLKAHVEEESKLLHSYNELRLVIEKEKDTNREAEKDIFRIIGRQNEVRGIISRLETDLTAVTRAEEDFKRELGEAAMIAGREAVEYEVRSVSHEGGSMENEERRRKIERSKIRLEDAGAGGGTEILKEFKETEDRDAFLAKEILDLEQAKSELNKLITDLDVRIDYEFKSGILKINAEFEKFFTLMFGGGTAELVVVRETKRRRKSDGEELGELLATGQAEYGGSTDYGEAEINGSESAANISGQDGPEGLDVNVNLPRKKVKGLMMLSGGERALTSIALLFAISQVNPPPFIILDETDAALDEANSKKYGDMIESLAKRSQLILITHNRETMSRAGVLYGVTMGSDGSSRLLSIAFEEAVQVAK